MHKTKSITMSMVICFASLITLDKAAANESMLEQRIEKAISKSIPSTVMVTAKTNYGPSIGSGFVVNAKLRLIATNYHVVTKATSISVRLVGDKDSLACDLIHYDSKRDLALIKIRKPINLTSEFSINADTKPRLGQFVVAIGSPGGYDFTTSLGIVSAINRKLLDQHSALRFLQIDAPMHQGSSGGPIVDLNGEVIGMTSRGGANGAAGFAIPATDIRQFLASAKPNEENRGQSTKFGYLGAVLQELTPAFQKALAYHREHGALVSYVHQESAAETAGLQPGDILIRIDNVNIAANDAATLQLTESYLAGIGPNRVKVVYWRNRTQRSAFIIMSERPPCKEDVVELDRVSLRIHNASSCYTLPTDKYVEVTRYWHRSGHRKDFIQKGDLITSLVGGATQLTSELKQVINGRSKEKHIVVVIRDNKPRLALIASLAH